MVVRGQLAADTFRFWQTPDIVVLCSKVQGVLNGESLFLLNHSIFQWRLFFRGGCCTFILLAGFAEEHSDIDSAIFKAILKVNFFRLMK